MEFLPIDVNWRQLYIRDLIQDSLEIVLQK